MADIAQDFRVALRVLRKDRAFALVSILALGLGIGANSTVYSTIKAMVLHPVAFPELDRLLTIGEIVPRSGSESVLAPANYRDLVKTTSKFKSLAALQGRGWDANVTGGGLPDRLEGYLVTPNFFRMLEMPPLLGRTFSDSEAAAGEVRQVVISHSAWQKHFAGDSHIVGRSLVLNGGEATIIGVMPREFDLPIGAEIWAPLSLDSPEMNSRADHSLEVIGRLTPGASLEQARAELDAIAANLERAYPETNTGRKFQLGLLRKEVIGETRHYIIILMWSAVFVLLLACANVANLQLARTTTHRKELAVRAALGAPRWRIARAVLAESALLSLFGGILGVLMAAWAIPLTRAAVPPFIVQHIAGVKNIRLDSSVLVFTAAIALLTGIVSGLIPALQACFAADVHETLKDAARGSSTSGRSRLRSLLVVTEVALALILLVGATLMVKGFRNLVQRNPGYDAASGLSFRVSLPQKKYASDRARADFYDRVTETLAAIPGVEGAAAVQYLPSGWAWQTGSFAIENAPRRAGEHLLAGMQTVTPDFFRVVRIPLRSGRLLSRQDGVATTPVVVITATMAKRYWPDSDPVGHRIRFAAGDPWRTIVGVVADIRQNTFDDEFRPTAYIPMAQAPPYSAGFVVRAARDPVSLATAARAALQSIDRDQPAYDIRALEQLITDNASGVEYSAHMMLAFGVIALLLAAAGIYAVMAYAVTQRTHEIGVRMALGAQHGDVLRMIIGGSVKLAALGLLFGVPIAFALMRLLSSLLVGVIRLDVSVLIVLTLMLTLVAALAGYVPARRATHVDPIAALRNE